MIPIFPVGKHVKTYWALTVYVQIRMGIVAVPASPRAPHGKMGFEGRGVRGEGGVQASGTKPHQSVKAILIL